MTARLVTPHEAVDTIRHRIGQKWAEIVSAEHGVGTPIALSVPLRPNLSTGRAVERIGYGHWHDWHAAWRTFDTQHLRDSKDIRIIHKPLTIHGVSDDYPATLVCENPAAAIELVTRTNGELITVDIERARTLATSLDAAGVAPSTATLKAAYRLADPDITILLAAVAWLHDHPDVSAWTARQLPVPGMHSKWLETHGALLETVTSRDVRAEVRPRLAVAHLTYTDPDYLASGKRRHDAWTTGDTHDLAYSPRIVLIVENRDCRLWFPPTPGTIVVEGNGKAAASLLAGIPWIRAADHVIYWGDIDADGYAILNRFRDTMASPTPNGLPATTIHSLLMDATDLHRYADHGVNHDKTGRPIKPSTIRLPYLTQSETTAYDALATAGPAPFRRIEQEAIPLTYAATRLKSLIDTLTTRSPSH
ncbi:Wadjet anti-phage system protein JetD domain-containing protein [Nocardia farcinica]|uniref:Wadjet anti-phage system protein JetD domain-containing protein n=1 Tax=Nocardia farcinica TaxID=37329 RepID=UPI002B4B94F2|nr:Wadjet anti-phage system protein JetD domain-containing protein [Nocardia farcinica]